MFLHCKHANLLLTQRASILYYTVNKNMYKKNVHGLSVHVLTVS